jgi:DNA-binding NarL/FixJ family response regulator
VVIRTLIADDEADIRTIVRLHMEMDGRFEVVAEAQNGVEALALVERHQPDLVVLDLMMPFKSGLDVLPSIRSQYPDTTVVVVSAMPADDAEQRAKALGAAAFIPKSGFPFGLADTLASAIGA